MVYPENFERKIGFDELRRLLKGRCLSALGTDYVDNELAPSTKYAEVVERLRLAAEFMRFEELMGDAYEASFFDVRDAVLHVRPERTYMEENSLFSLMRSLHTCVVLRRLFASEAVDELADDADGGAVSFPALAGLAEGVDDFSDLTESIGEVLNRYGHIKDTASPTLLTVRHSIEVTTRSIGHSLRSIIADAQQAGYIERDTVPTLRDGRLVIPVSPSAKRKIKGIVHDESATGKTVFIEPAAVVDANNKIRELQAEEKREIVRILQRLTDLVRPRIAAILDAMRFLARVDYLRALAALSEELEAVVPQVERRPVLRLLEARHPLLQRQLRAQGGSVVPIDVKLPEGARILVISGPNAGGKSVSLKTVGLLQYMLQCGMPVPADERSRMGVFEGLFIDIGDEQSLADELSTYSGHLNNMKQMMRHASERSLLLIDEFGAGTEPLIGGALAEAILHRFIESGAWGVVTTHYQNLKRVAEQYPTVVNGAMLYDRHLMQPLFRLQVGNPGSSFAIEIARKTGLPDAVIAEAQKMVGDDYIMSDKYLQDIVRDKMYWETKRRNIHKREKQLEETIARYEEDLQRLSRERKEVLGKARDEAQQLLSQTNARIENTIRTIKEAQAERERTKEVRGELAAFREEVEQTTAESDAIARKLAKIQRRQERKRSGRNDGGRRRTAGQDAPVRPSAQEVDGRSGDAGFAVGDTVMAVGQGSVGRVVSISGKKAKVTFGMVNMLLPLGQLRHADAPEPEQEIRVATFLSKETRDAMYEKKLHFRPEIDLRGMRYEEAVKAVAYFIDDAIQTEAARVRILHGTGTGALREAVRGYLQGARGVKRFHDEHVQFGGAGVTVVELQ